MERVSIIKKVYRKVYYGIVIPTYEKVKKVDFYQNIAPVVDEHNQYMITTLLMRYRLRKWFRRQKITEKDRILDVGCGKGRIAQKISWKAERKRRKTS